MKKVISMLLIVCMLLVAGCSGSSAPASTPASTPASVSSTTEAAPEKHDPVFLEFGGAGLGTATYTQLAAYGEFINAQSDFVQVNVQTTAGSIAHYQMFLDKALQIATGAGSTDKLSWEGGNEIFPNQMRGQRTILVFGRTFQTVMVPVNSGINSMSDLNGKKITIGNQASPSGQIAQKTLSSLGIKADLLFGTSAEQVEQYKDGRADAYMMTSSAGNANVVDAQNTIESKFIALTDEEIKKCLEGDLKGLSSPSKLTNEQYNWIPVGEEYNVMTEFSCLNVLPEMEDHVVYELLDLYWKNYDELHSNFIGLNCGPEDILLATIPVHPGAAKYYKEVWNIDIPADRIMG